LEPYERTTAFLSFCLGSDPTFAALRPEVLAVEAMRPEGA
jgi:hypothetical protein